MERAAFKDADQLLTNGLLVGFAPAIERNCRHGLTPNAARQPSPASIGIPLHTRTSRLGLSRFRIDRFLSSTIRKERSHEIDKPAPCPLYHNGRWTAHPSQHLAVGLCIRPSADALT